MKNILSFILLLHLSISLKGQNIEAGVYNTALGNYPISIKYTESGNILYKDYSEKVEYIKQADGKFTHAKYPQLYITAVGKNTIVQADANSAFKKEFILYAPAKAKTAEGVMSFEWNGDTYYAKKVTDEKFIGLYTYPGKEPRFFEYAEGEPIILLNSDQTGKYQRHGMKSIPIQWWIESDPNGKLQVIDGALVHRYYLVVQFGPGNPYDKEGQFERMNLDVYKDGSKVVILGEREKKLK